MKKPLHTKKIAAVLTAAALAFGFAAPVCAASAAPKDETVYVNMDAVGKVDAIYVVNSFELSAPNTVTDYGNYAEVTDLTADAPTAQDGETVTMKAPAGKVSYQGKLRKNSTPWNIVVQYFLDEKGIAPQDLGGKSGALRITLNIKQNPDFDKIFFDHYALQIAMTLDGEKCKNIVAPDATVANAGGSKQLAFIVLPGTESALEMTADVTDFAMPAISINGVAMNLSIDVDSLLKKDEAFKDIGDLGTMFSDLTDGTKGLLDGVGALKQGAGKLDDGARSLCGGAQELQNGAGALYSGVGSLNAGAAQLSTGIGTISANSASLVSGARQIVDQLFVQVNDQIAAQGIVLPERLTLENYTAVLAGQMNVTDAVRAAAESTFLAQLAAQGMAQEEAAAVLPLVEVLANPMIAQGAASQTAIAQALGMIGLVNGTQAALTAAAGDALQIPAVQSVLGGMVPAMGADITAVYTMLKGQLQSAAPAPDDAACAQLITMACLSAAGGTTAFDLAQAAQTAGAVGQAAAADEPTKAAAKVAFFNTIVMENLGGQLAPLKAQLDGIAAFYNGLVQYTGGVNQLAGGAGALASGVAQLQTGVGALQGGIGTFASGLRDYEQGVAQYKTGVASVYGGVKQLNDGTAAFGGLEETGSNLLDGIMGGDFTPVSFTSPKNTAVHSVQFVMKTEAIEKAAPAVTAAQEEATPDFWQRVKNLFA